MPCDKDFKGCMVCRRTSDRTRSHQKLLCTDRMISLSTNRSRSRRCIRIVHIKAIYTIVSPSVTVLALFFPHPCRFCRLRVMTWHTSNVAILTRLMPAQKVQEGLNYYVLGTGAAEHLMIVSRLRKVSRYRDPTAAMAMPLWDPLMAPC
jgi:hypothetical protein